ncbi:MAG: ABC transporter substrate-binding protein [Dongiaceae bacterium]
MTKRNRHGVWIAGLLAMLAAPPAVAEGNLTVVGWGGAYSEAQLKAQIEPFEAETGVDVTTESYSGGVAELKAQVESGAVTWDVIDMELSDAVRACDDGLLEPVGGLALVPAADGTPAAEDYLPGGLFECGVGTSYVSAIIAYNASAFAGDKPTQVADFFDLERFPGKRALYRNPSRTLELTLLADGVPGDKVYEVLATKEGQDRAFAKLDSIRSSIVWWEAGAQAPQLLADKEATMAIAWNGRIFNAQVKEKQPFEILWDAQVLELSAWVIAKDAPNRQAAEDFVVFASSPASLARVATYIPYGPSRRSASALVGKNPDTGIEMAPYLPTAPDHLANVVQLDPEFWATHGDVLNERFAAWLAQ